MRTASKRISALVAAVLIVFMTAIPASPATAKTVYDLYFNGVTGKLEGSYTYLDCRGCPDDGTIRVSNVKNGYHVRVRFYAYANGTWNRYLDRYIADGYQAKWRPGYPPAGARVRLQICTTNSSYQVVGYCTDVYTYNNSYK